MERVILIRFGEIFLKGNNKYYFESVLKKNIKLALSTYKHSFVFSQNRFYVEGYDHQDENSIIDSLTCIFGLHSVSLTYKVANSMPEIEKAVKAFLPLKKTFKIYTNRADKRFPGTSMDISKDLGSFVLDNDPNTTVDVVNPLSLVSVDIRENGFTYVYADKIMCLGGMPVGTSGHGLALLSGGIDSPVAIYMMAKRGMKISAVHFHSFPYTSVFALDKVKKLGNLCSKYVGNITLNIVKVTKIQEEIHNKCPEFLMITLLRRMMMRIATILAVRMGAQALVTGESLGQVASQTIESMTCTGAVTDLPIMRPLVAFDKSEIVDIAKKIKTFETSIEPHQDCCTVFLPKNPAIHPTMDVVIEAEKALDIVGLIAEALLDIEQIRCKQSNDDITL